MFNAPEILIDSFVDQLQRAYTRNWGNLEPSFPDILGWAGRMVLERIADSDALYHDVEHTILVTLVGQEILKGRHMREGGVSPSSWMHFIISLLCHDIGYVRGVCRGDVGDTCVTGSDDQTVMLPPGATDASLTPFHVDRGKLFIRERFGGHPTIDAEKIVQNIELTRFPVPTDSDHRDTATLKGLVRAADLIGQLADLGYRRKLPALFHEFKETGTAERLGYQTPADLAAGYPAFYWKVVSPFIQDGLRYLHMTQQGKLWIASLHGHVFALEHGVSV
jgi:hypothetical protein